MIDVNSRLFSFLLASLAAVILSASFYFESVLGFNPCPLCLMQRFCVMLILLCTLMQYFLRYDRILRSLIWLQLFISVAGIFFAGRQVFLQFLPTEEMPVCLPGLKMIINYLPWQEVVKTLFLGGSDCAEITWTWLGLSMPAWAMLYFVGMFFATSLICWRQGRVN